MNQTTPTYLMKKKSFIYEKSDASLPHNNDATEPLITRNERDERKKQSMEPSLA